LEGHRRGWVRYRPPGVESQPTIEGRWLTLTAKG
jgi:hypothetical protein